MNGWLWSCSMAQYIPRFESIGFFIFITNFRDNVYLTPPGTQKELRIEANSASMSGKTPKFFIECKGGHF
jgi:hypothetical protein